MSLPELDSLVAIDTHSEDPDASSERVYLNPLHIAAVEAYTIRSTTLGGEPRTGSLLRIASTTRTVYLPGASSNMVSPLTYLTTEEPTAIVRRIEAVLIKHRVR